MDYFSLFLDILTLTGQGVMHIFFVSRLTGKQKKLEAVSETLSFPYQTGNPIVDILLGEKLGLAKEIAAEVFLVLPKPSGNRTFQHQGSGGKVPRGNADGEKWKAVLSERAAEYSPLQF